MYYGIAVSTSKSYSVPEDSLASQTLVSASPSCVVWFHEFVCPCSSASKCERTVCKIQGNSVGSQEQSAEVNFIFEIIINKNSLSWLNSILIWRSELKPPHIFSSIYHKILLPQSCCYTYTNELIKGADAQAKNSHLLQFRRGGCRRGGRRCAKLTKRECQD